MLSPLMKSRFVPLFWCQFLAAFNDNFLKNALVFLVLFRIEAGGASLVTLSSAASLSSAPTSAPSPI